jgi:NAD(P)H-hydrate epimerase
MVMLRALILSGLAQPESAALVINRPGAQGEHSPRSEAYRSLEALGVPGCRWESGAPGKSQAEQALGKADILIDGIVGTGLRGPLGGTLAEMAAALGGSGGTDQDEHGKGRLVVSIDVPSGNFDHWKPGMPILRADLTLAIAPVKQCLYGPAARPFAGTIVPVEGIFPPALIAAHGGAELVTWKDVRARLPPISAEAYKRQRGAVEIRAGSPP